ncbi:unnamed protein product [Closterium sp. NIES-65]|nr:unnamed protein product [Closterium sp. NIES-65]
MAQLAFRNHIPPDQWPHFRSLKTTKVLHDAVVKRYSSPTSTTQGRLVMPFLFPEMSDFTTIADLMTHLCSLEMRYCAALKPKFLAEYQPPMYLTLYFLTARLRVSLYAAETIVYAIASSGGTPRPSFFEGCSTSLLALAVASAAATAADFLEAEEVDVASSPGGR